MNNVLMGHILYDLKWRVAQQKIFKCRLDFVYRNTSINENFLNGPKRLKESRELNDLVASVAEVVSEVSEEKARKKKQK